MVASYMQQPPLAASSPYLMIWQKDLRSVYTYANDMTLELFGLNHLDKLIGITDEMIPCKISELAKKFQQDDLAVMNSGKSKTLLEIVQCTKNNDWKILQTTKTASYDSNKRITGTLSFCMDITHSLTTLRNFFLKDHQIINAKNTFSLNYEFNAKIEQFNLSPKQSECLFYLLRGMTSKKIADILKVSPRTIEAHVMSIKHKMDCSNKSEVIDKALAMGLQNIIPNNIFSRQASFAID